jgi:O-acetyl-ADP-ribose deacetylase (regulator of RNase III)
MFPKVIFIDIKPDLVTKVSSLLEENPTITLNDEVINIKDYFNYECVVGNIANYIDNKNTAFTSAANGEGMLLGGVDSALRNMFPVVQPIIEETIMDNGFMNKYRDHFIPVGSSTIVPVCDTDENFTNNNQYLITAPTMLNPSNVKNTNNCYHALYAVFRVVYKFNQHLKESNKPLIDTVLCPGMGTGVGGISSEDAASQFLQAIQDFVKVDLSNKYKPDGDSEMYQDISENPNVFIKCPIKMIMEQPHWYTYVRYRKKTPEQPQSESNTEQETQ